MELAVIVFIWLMLAYNIRVRVYEDDWLSTEYNISYTIQEFVGVAMALTTLLSACHIHVNSK